MAGYSEEYGELKIEQRQVDGWVDGTYNTYVTYCGKELTVKYNFYVLASGVKQRQREMDPADTLYGLTNGIDLIVRCKLYKDLLNDIAHLKLKMAMKIKNGLKYNFDVGFVNDSLKKTVNVVHDDVQEIYMNLQFEAMSEGRQFFIPLPDNTIQNKAEEYTENEQNTDIAIKDNTGNETLEIIKKDTTLIIELVKKLQQEKERPEYIDALIQQGYIAGDGRTALTSLDNIAEFLLTKIEVVTPLLLITFFRKEDGSKYSLRSAQDAIQRNKTH